MVNKKDITPAFHGFYRIVGKTASKKIINCYVNYSNMQRFISIAVDVSTEAWHDESSIWDDFVGSGIDGKGQML